MKFFGIYQQDDRDIRDERRRQKLEPAYSFMARVRLPGGVCSPSQWLKLDALARAHAGETLRLTTRQTFQLHRVSKHDLRTVMQGLHDVLLDTKAACGDDTRGVMCAVNPDLSTLHAEVYALAKQASDHAVPKTRRLRRDLVRRGARARPRPEEPFYGRTYMPRKFKIGFAVPPSQRHRRLQPGPRLHRHRGRWRAEGLQRRDRRRPGPHRPGARRPIRGWPA